MNDHPLTIVAPSPSHSQIEAFADACTLLASVSSRLVINDDIRRSLSSAVHSWVETTYFLLIFLCHFLIDQLSEQITHPLKTLFISTFTHWFGSILHYCEQPYNFPELACLLPICALRSVYLTYVFTSPCQNLADLFRNAVSATCSSEFLPVLHTSPDTVYIYFPEESGIQRQSETLLSFSGVFSPYAQHEIAAF